ncbi:MAG: hypothetical protein WD295_01620, partial [Bacteroidota bacterium]
MKSSRSPYRRRSPSARPPKRGRLRSPAPGKHRADSLRRESAIFRTLVDKIHEGVVLVDEKMKITFA